MSQASNHFDIVFIPFHDWRKCEREGFRTRDGHLMQEFSVHPAINRLLIVDRPLSLAERILYRRKPRIEGGKLIWQGKHSILSQVSSKTFVLDIMISEVFQPILKRRGWIPYIFQKEQTLEQIQIGIKVAGLDRQLGLVISEPFFAPSAQTIQPDIFVLDAIDNLLKHPHYRKLPGIQAAYDDCLDKCDLIFTNSIENASWFSKSRPDTQYIPNGVDTRVFNAEFKYEIPKDIQPLKRPVVGYAGKMQEMFDVPMLLQAAKAFPEVSFVCIGQKLNPAWVKPLWLQPNVYYLGDKYYLQMPAYVSAFDICIIPYSKVQQHGGDPIKFYEYLALHKPVVTTDIGGVARFNDFPNVQIVRNSSEFTEALGSFINSLIRGKTIQFGELPKEVLWSEKVNLMVKSIQEIACRE
jgi:teichuronic acid biosynthesis glycosyltransferase TuaH